MADNNLWILKRYLLRITSQFRQAVEGNFSRWGSTSGGRLRWNYIKQTMISMKNLNLKMKMVSKCMLDFFFFFLANLCNLHGGFICITLLVCTLYSLDLYKILQNYMGRDQRSKVTWFKVSLRLVILADGLTSTSSCIFYSFMMISGTCHMCPPLQRNSMCTGTQTR